MKAFNYALAAVIVAFFIVATGVYVYLLFFETSWLVYSNLPFPAKLKIVRPNEVAPLEVVRCNNSGFKRTYNVSHAMRNLDTGELLILRGVTAPIDPGCTRDTSFINRVPKTAPPGRYRAEGTAEVKKTLRTAYVDWYSEPFIVAGDPAP